MTPGSRGPHVVLMHSPLTTAAAWGGLPEALRAAAYDVLVPSVTADDDPPYATRYVADAARSLLAEGPSERRVLVGHSGAGPLLPLVARAQRSAGVAVRGYVFLDAGLPPGAAAGGSGMPPTRLEQLRAEDGGLAENLERDLAAGGRFPDYGDRLPAPLGETLRPRGLGFFSEPLPRVDDWPDAPCAYVQLSPAYAAPARQAELRGWPVLRRDLGHFGAFEHPAETAQVLGEALGVVVG